MGVCGRDLASARNGAVTDPLHPEGHGLGFTMSARTQSAPWCQRSIHCTRYLPRRGSLCHCACRNQSMRSQEGSAVMPRFQAQRSVSHHARLSLGPYRGVVRCGGRGERGWLVQFGSRICLRHGTDSRACSLLGRGGTCFFEWSCCRLSACAAVAAERACAVFCSHPASD